jgi:NAD(P)-dependent dehydrogenase (short-subunit alcohol dehydrogenase family)
VRRGAARGFALARLAPRVLHSLPDPTGELNMGAEKVAIVTKTAAIEYAPDGMRVNVVCPGAHRTPMLQGVFEAISPGSPEKAEALYRARIPAGRIGEPEECARAIAWLLSDAASYVNGPCSPSTARSRPASPEARGSRLQGGYRLTTIR